MSEEGRLLITPSFQTPAGGDRSLRSQGRQRDFGRPQRKNKKAAGLCAPSLRRADLAEEVGDLVAEILALRLQRLARALHVLGGSRRRVGIGFDAGDVVRD